MDHIGVTVNGRERPLRGVSAHTTALDWLRGLGLTGCKEGYNALATPGDDRARIPRSTWRRESFGA